MSFIVVLDACVLYPASLRDTLLRLAEVEMYDVAWSQRILDEAVATLSYPPADSESRHHSRRLLK